MKSPIQSKTMLLPTVLIAVLVSMVTCAPHFTTPSTVRDSKHHTTLHTTDISLKDKSTITPNPMQPTEASSLTKTANFNARLVISNSKANGSSVWGLTQDEAEKTCRLMAKKQDSPFSLFDQMGLSQSPLADFFQSLHERFINRFAKAQKIEYGSLFAVQTMGQLELLNKLFGRFFPTGSFWSGGKLVKNGEHYKLTWLDKNGQKHEEMSAEHPTIFDLLQLTQTEVDKLAEDGEFCLAIKKVVAKSHTGIIPFGLNSLRHQGIFGTTVAPKTATTKTMTTTPVSTATVSTKHSKTGITWELHKCNDRLPYACLLHYAESKETSTQTTSSSIKTTAMTDSSFPHTHTVQTTMENGIRSVTPSTASAINNRFVTDVTHHDSKATVTSSTFDKEKATPTAKNIA